MKKSTIVIALVVALILVVQAATIALAARPVDAPGNGPPNLNKVVFVHYPKGLEAKGGIPGAPVKPPKDDDDDISVKKLWYKYSGIHWDSPSASYYYNSTGNPGDFISAINTGFNTWTAVEGSSFSFSYIDYTDQVISSLDDIADGINVVGWADLDEYNYSNAIAVTMVWYNASGIIQEVDMAFNNNEKFMWSQNGDGDEIWDNGNTPNRYDVDVQNIATHEAGHWLLLGDMYNKPASSQTMYGISAEFDLQKRSLEDGDIAGIKAIYP